MARGAQVDGHAVVWKQRWMDSDRVGKDELIQMLSPDELEIAQNDHDLFVTLLGSIFAVAQWQDEDTAIYRSGVGEPPAVTLKYKKRQIAALDAGPGLSDETRTSLHSEIAAFATTSETVVWRDVFFGILPVHGYWRHRDAVQVMPAPPQAPRPPVVLGEHPFIVEFRVPWYHGQGMLDSTIRARRAWELQLVLNLVLRGRIRRFSARGPDPTWARVVDGAGGLQTEWVQPGYSIPDWNYQSADFTPTDSVPALAEVPDEDYRTRRGISSDDVVEIPAILRPVLDASRAVGAKVREQFLRACYWYERAGASWNVSVSLGHIAAVNAIETIMPSSRVDRCSECGLNRAPGPTRRFKNFVDRYAPLVPESDRLAIYRLRSALVHEGKVLDIDLPAPWAAWNPHDERQRDTYQAAQVVARDTIIGWLLEQGTDDNSNSH